MIYLASRNTILYNWSDKHKDYIRATADCNYNVAEGSIRSGKTVDNIFAFAHHLKTSQDKLHLVTASTQGSAKIIVGDSDGFGLEHIFRGQCRWGKYLGNEALLIKGKATRGRLRVVMFCGGAKADSYKKFRGITIGQWLATEVNLHHKETIEEAMKRQISAHTKRLYWDLNPENPNDMIYRDYLDKWQEASERGDFVGGYNYQTFNIYDNVNIPEKNLQEFVSKYTVGTVRHTRDVLGKRAVADGAIYEILQEQRDAFMVNKEDVPPLRNINIGEDFGKSQSKHALVCCGFDAKGNLYVTSAKCMNAKGKTTVDLYEWTATTVEAMHEHGKPKALYCDSAEPTLINSLRQYVKVPIYNSVKKTILERIKAVDTALATRSIFFVRGETEELVDALASSVWEYDKGSRKESRRDDGSYNNDVIDAFEYSVSYNLSALTKRRIKNDLGLGR